MAGNSVPNQHQKGRIIPAPDARKMVDDYLRGTGSKQPDPNDPEFVYGYIYGLAAIRDLLFQIDNYNLNAPFDEQITALHFYQAKSKRDNDVKDRSDIVVIPIKRNGEDFKVDNSETLGGGGGMALAMSVPCPNVCNN